MVMGYAEMRSPFSSPQWVQAPRWTSASPQVCLQVSSRHELLHPFISIKRKRKKTCKWLLYFVPKAVMCKVPSFQSIVFFVLDASSASHGRTRASKEQGTERPEQQNFELVYLCVPLYQTIYFFFSLCVWGEWLLFRYVYLVSSTHCTSSHLFWPVVWFKYNYTCAIIHGTRTTCWGWTRYL